MNQRRLIALVAGVATLLTSTVFSTIFQLYGWFYQCLMAITVVVGMAVLARLARLPVWAQLPVMLFGLMELLTWSFPSGHEVLRIVPTAGTFRHFGDLLSAAGQDISKLSLPVGDRNELLFLVAMGVGLIAVLVDLLAVGLHQPALAGLPLLAMYSVPVAIHHGGLPWIPFALGAAGYLWLLITDHIGRVRGWGRRFRGDGKDMDQWAPSPLAGSGRRIGLVGLVLAIALPFLVPGLSTGLLTRLATYANSTGGGIGTGIGPGTGEGESINPVTTLRGQLRMNKPENLFTVTTQDPSPQYLRTAVADQITDQGFQPHTPPNSPAPLGDLDPAAQVALTPAEFDAQVRTQALDDRYLPLFDHPTKVQPPRHSRWYRDPATDVVYAAQPGTGHTSYSFSYDTFDLTGATLRAAPPLPSVPDDALKVDLELKGQTQVLNQVRTRAGAITGGAGTEYDRALAVLNSFAPSNGFHYSLSTKQGTSGSAILDFLANKQGYCEQYASAMVWLLRAADIPSRVVVGYTHGLRVGNTNGYQVTTHNAHAWVEAYFPRYGWVPFDPTPGLDVVGSVSFGWAPNPGTPTGGPSAAPTPTGVAGGPASAGPTDKQHGGHGLTQANGQKHRPAPTWPWWVLAGVLAVLMVLALPAAWRLARRRSRRELARRAGRDGPPGGVPRPGVPPDGGAPAVSAGPATRQAAHAAWDELLDTLVDLALATHRSETPRATAARLTATAGPTRLGGPAAASVRLLADAEEHARYAREPLVAGDLREAGAAVRDGLRGQVPWRTRVRAALLPRSVLRRWRQRIGAAVSGTTARIGAAQHALARLPRLLTPRRFAPRRNR